MHVQIESLAEVRSVLVEVQRFLRWGCDQNKGHCQQSCACDICMALRNTEKAVTLLFEHFGKYRDA